MRSASLMLACALVACSADDGSTFDAGADATSAPDADAGFCGVYCQADPPVPVDVSCLTAKVTSATLGGACEGGTFTCLSGPEEVPFVDCDPAFFSSHAVGDCDVRLELDDGFTYVANVHFSAEPGTFCCPNTLYEPSPPSLTVEEPDAGCADASAE